MKKNWKTTAVGFLKLGVAIGLLGTAAVFPQYTAVFGGLAGVGQLLSSIGFLNSADGSAIKDSAMK